MAAPPPSPPPPPPPVLPDDVVEEILLYLPPDEPAWLLRVSLVCKDWWRVASSPRFRRRLDEAHGPPPVLGFFHDWEDERIPNFVSTIDSPFSLAAPERWLWRPLDCRHGRALFHSRSKDPEDPEELLVWEPIKGAHHRIPLPAEFFTLAVSQWPTAAVFCTADGCDHERDCLGGPFGVVFVFYAADEENEINDVTSACVYSSETGTWGELTSTHDEFSMHFEYHSSVLVGESLLYFLSDGGLILEYDLGSHAMAVLDTPSSTSGVLADYEDVKVLANYEDFRFALVLAEDGGLGVVEALNPELIVWSRNDDGQWEPSQFIDLHSVLPTAVGPQHFVTVLGFAEGEDAIFVRTYDRIYMIELESQTAWEVCKNHGFCNLIPLVSFYTPPPKLEGAGHQGGWEKKSLKWAQEMFHKGCKAMNEKDFNNAVDCFRYALKIRVQRYGRLALECASTFSRYGCALLYRAREATNPPGNVSKRAPNKESMKITPTTSTSKDDAGSSEASSSSAEHVPPSSKGDYEEGANLIGKDREDGNMTDGDDSDLDLAWKMLNTAREIVAKSPEHTGNFSKKKKKEHTGEKFNIFYALAEVSMRREDRDNSISYYIKALAILEHLVGPDHIRIANLNFRICLALELASKIGDAIPYCAKAISVCNSCMKNLEKAKEASLADKNVSASAAKECSENLENEISSLLDRFQKKLGELEQAMSTPSSCIDKTMKNVVSVTCPEQNVRNTMAGSNNSPRSPTMSTAATTGTAASSVTDLVIVGRDMKRGNDKPIPDEPSPKRLTAEGSPSVNEM